MDYQPLTRNTIQTLHTNGIKMREEKEEKERKEREEREEKKRQEREKERAEEEEKWKKWKEEAKRKDEEEKLMFINTEVTKIYKIVYSELTTGTTGYINKYYYKCDDDRYGYRYDNSYYGTKSIIDTCKKSKCSCNICITEHLISGIMEKLKEKFPDSKVDSVWVAYNTDSEKVEYHNYDDLHNDIEKRIPIREDTYNYEYGGYDFGESKKEYEERKKEFEDTFQKMRCIVIDWN